ELFLGDSLKGIGLGQRYPDASIAFDLRKFNSIDELELIRALNDAWIVSSASCNCDRQKNYRKTQKPHRQLETHLARLARGRFLPRAVFFFPIVKWFAVDLVNRRLGNFHLARLAGQKEINIVGLAVGSFHVHTGEVFAAAEILQSIIMYFCQIERQILTFVCVVKFSVGTFFAFRGDIALYAGGNISRAHSFLSGFPFCRLLWVLLSVDLRCRCKK